MSKYEREIKQRVLVAVRWTLIAKFTGQVISWVSTFIVIRLLMPEDYGLMGMAQIFISTLMMFTISGMGDGIIQAKNITESQLRQFFAVIILLNLSLSALTYFSAPYIAKYYSEPRVAAILQVQAFAFIIQIFIALPNALLSREINFKHTSIVNLLASLAGVGTTLSMAFLGHGVWALVFGMIVTALTRAIGLNIIRPCFILPIFKFSDVKELITFGLIATLNTLVWSLYLRADIFIGGRYLNTETIGIYVIALMVATLGFQKIMPIITPLAFPFFSRLQDDEADFRFNFIRYMRISATLIYPIALGTAAIAPEFIKLVLGEKWDAAVTSVILLSFAVLPRSGINLFSPALRAKNKALVSLGNGTLMLIVLVALFLLALPWGIEGIAASWLTGSSVVFVIAFYRSSRALDISPRRLLKELAPPFLAGAIMYGGVRVFSLLGIGAVNEWVELSLMIIAGSMLYILGIRILAPTSIPELLKFRKLIIEARQKKGTLESPTD